MLYQRSGHEKKARNKKLCACALPMSRSKPNGMSGSFESVLIIILGVSGLSDDM